MGIVRGTVRVMAAMLLAITTVAVLAQPASAEPDVQIGKVCSDAGNRRIRLKQDTDLLIQWFLDGTPYLEPSTDTLILTTVPGDGSTRTIELKHMPDKVVIATFEVTFELCEQPTVSTEPPATTQPSTTKQTVPTTASTTAPTTASTTDTTAAPTSLVTTTTLDEPASTTETTEGEAPDVALLAGDGADRVLGAFLAIMPTDAQSDDLAAGDGDATAQTLPPDDILSPPPSLASSDDLGAADTNTSDADGSSMLGGMVVVGVIAAIAAGLVGLLVGRRRSSADASNPDQSAGPEAVVASPDEALPSASELLAARSGTAPVFSETERATDPLPQRQRRS